MKKIILVIGFLIASLQLYAQDQKIFGGQAIDIADAPYQVSLELNGVHNCGGTIIDCEWIVTAGHCVDGNTTPEDLVVHAGSTNQTDNGVGQRIEVVEIIIHPAYTPFGAGNVVATNDIALLRLANPLAFNDDVTAIDYATPGNTTAAEIGPGEIGFISGWGDAGAGTEPNLLGASLPIITNAAANNLINVGANDCQPAGNNPFGNSMISFWQEGIAAGPGDSGGPAVLGRGAEATLIGVSSWGGCDRDEFPTVYANVRNLSDFIDDNLISVNGCCDDNVEYHYEDENGNDQTEFCVGEDVYVNGSDTFNTNNYFMDLWIVDGNGDYDWISGAGWISGSPDFVNITDLFENDPEHPVTFQVGETYSVKLAINHPNCGWISVQHDFTIIKPDSVSYHYEDENGNDQTEFCEGEDVFVNGSDTINTSNYFMDLWIVDGNGDYDWISGAGWISGSPDFVNITDLFENDPENPVTFQEGRTYSVKLAINDPNCGWVSLQHDFTIIAPDSVSYHYEDENGNDQSTFCEGEDVFVNGSTTLNTSNYFMDLWIVDDNGDYDWISGAGWTSGSPDFVNITDLFENDPENPVTFQSGRTYSVKLAINDPNCGWVSLQHDFTIVAPDSVSYHYENANGNDQSTFCVGEDVFLNGSATLNTSNYFMDLWIVDDNGDYDWISGAGWISGSPDFVNITDLFENDPENPVTFQAGRTYSVKLAINDPNCGWVSLQHNFDIVTCFICEEVETPINLQTIGNTLTWDPVLEATYYKVSSSVVDASQAYCRCGKQVSVVSLTTPTNSVTIPEDFQKRCFSWSVIAVCENEIESQPSLPQCFIPIRDGKTSDFVKASIFPNPNNGDMNFKIKTNIDTDVTVEIYSLYGTKIHSFTMNSQKELETIEQWNATDILKTGIYFVSFITDKEMISKKVIIKK